MDELKKVITVGMTFTVSPMFTREDCISMAAAAMANRTKEQLVELFTQDQVDVTGIQKSLEEDVDFSDPPEWGARHEELDNQYRREWLQSHGYDVRDRIEYVHNLTREASTREELAARMGLGFLDKKVDEVLETSYRPRTIMTRWDNRFVPGSKGAARYMDQDGLMPAT